MPTSQNTMEYIWDHLPKQKDGRTIRYLKGDVNYLYSFGFVDTRKYTLKEWRLALKPYKQKDESFILNKNQFLTLRLYRYEAPSYEPFDASKIEKGPWDDKSLQHLFDRSIGIASNVTSEMFWKYVNTLKSNKDFIDKNGNLVINKAVQFGFQVLVNKFPSPRTMLENEVARIKTYREEKLTNNQKNRDGSTFTVGQTEKENKALALQTLQSSKAVQKTKDNEPDNKETIDIKSLRRPTGKFRG